MGIYGQRNNGQVMNLLHRLGAHPAHLNVLCLTSPTPWDCNGFTRKRYHISRQETMEENTSQINGKYGTSLKKYILVSSIFQMGQYWVTL